MIRVSSGQFTYNYKISLNEAYSKQGKLMEQADGNRLHRPSDDSVAYAKYLKFDVAENENLQYQNNVKSAVSWMQNADAAEVLMTEIMSTFKEKTDAAANGTNNENDMQAIAREMLSEIQQLVALGNTQQGDSYVFGGQSDMVRPFELSLENKDRGLAKTLDDKQTQFFFTDNSANTHTDEELGSLRQFLTLEYNDGGEKKTCFLDPNDGYIYSKEFVDGDANSDTSFRAKMAAGQKLDRANDSIGQITVATDPYNPAAGDFTVSQYFDSQGIIQTTGTPPQPKKLTGVSIKQPDGTTTTVELNFKTISQPIVTYTGDEKHISMVKLNGAIDPTSDTVNSTGQDLFGSDIFDNKLSGNGKLQDGSIVASGSAMLNNMLTVYAKVKSGEDGQLWLDTDGVTISDKAHATVVTEEARVGARNQLYVSVNEMLDKQNENIVRDLTDVSATDVADLAVQLMTQQTLYNLSLSMGARLIPQSLADYL